MITPNNRREFEKHIAALYEGIQQGRHQFSYNPRIFNSLVNVRKTPNKRINFLTINETARVIANSRMTFDSPQFKDQFDAEE